MPESSVIILVADGLTADALDAAVARGDVPELAALRDAGGRHVLTTSFPSVTGVAYLPFLTGVHPAVAGIPGLRWYDRSRRLPALFGYSRSYVGTQIGSINHDLDPHVRTLFDVAADRALGMHAVVTRGLPAGNRIDRGWRHALRAVRAHVRGDIGAWAALERGLAELLVDRIRRERPRFVLAAFTAGDKAAHAAGIGAPGVSASLKLVDDVVGRIRTDAERGGRWSSMHLWVVSDHGHSPVHQHLDLASAARDAGIRVRSHPWTVPDRSEIAVMVSGNSMAHVYLDLASRRRLPWPDLEKRWSRRLEWLRAHPAIDLVAALRSDTTVEVRRRGECGIIDVESDRFSYTPCTGDPLGLDEFFRASEEEAHERTMETSYPDSVVQLARLVRAERSGDLVVSAAPFWDLRRRYEPIDHVSSHGALHGAHVLVPLTGNRPFADRPRRTADLFRLAWNILQQ